MKSIHVFASVLAFAAATATGAAALAQARPMPSSTVAPQPLAAETLATISKALVEADVPALDKLYENPPDPATRVLAAMALERIHFNLDKANADAQVCVHALLDSQPRVALYCAEFANGNLRLAHGAAAADAAEADIIRTFAGKLPAAALQGMRTWSTTHVSPPPPRVSMPASDFSIPLDTYIQRGLGAIKVSANGASTWLLVDTGSSSITLDADTARKLGARLQATPAHTSGLISKHIPERVGVLPHLQFSGVSIDNAPVRVLPGHLHLIGIDMLRLLGAFRLSRDSLTVYPGQSSRPPCQHPLLVATGLWGNQLHLVAALPIDGQLHTTLLDSGTSYFLSASESATAYLHPVHNTRMRVRDMGARTHHPRVSRVTSRLEVDGQAFEVTAPIFKDARLPWDFILGSGAMRHMDLYVDFDNRHTCLLLHHPVQ